MSQKRVRDLNEDLAEIGLAGGIDLSLAGLVIEGKKKSEGYHKDEKAHKGDEEEAHCGGEDDEKNEEVRAGQYFVVVDTKKSQMIGGLYQGTKKADAAAAKMEKKGMSVQVMDAMYFNPARKLLKAKGMIGEDEVSEESYVDLIAEEVYNDIRSQIEDEDIDYDVDQFESDLLDAITGIVEMNLSGLDEDEMTEGFLNEQVRKIIKSVRGKLQVVKQKLKSRADRMMDKMKRRKNRGKNRASQKKYRRGSTFKKSKKRRSRQMSRASGSVKRIMKQRRESEDRMSDLMGLLESNGRGPRGMTDVERELEEAYCRVFEIADTLASFFEENGEEDDLHIAESLTDMIQKLDEDVDSLSEGEIDIASSLRKLQVYGKMVLESVNVFNEYSLVEMAHKDDEDDDDDEEEDYE
jgi:hypothetical protein